MTPYGATDVGSTPRPDQTSPLQRHRPHVTGAHDGSRGGGSARRVADRPVERPGHGHARSGATSCGGSRTSATASRSSERSPQSFGVVIAAAWINTWWSYLIAFVLMTRGHVCLNILAHEAAHRLLFTESPAQRQRRPLAARLPDVPGDARLPPRPLRAPSRRDGPRRTRPRAVRRLSHPEGLVAPQAEARRDRQQRVEELQVARPGHPVGSDARRSRSSPCRR